MTAAAAGASGAAPALTEGELWSRELLRELQGDGYRPHAWCRFLERSLERAAETRRERPALARQADAWAAVWLGAAAAARVRPLAHVLPLVPPARELLWWLSAAALLRWHLGMVEGPRGEPRPRLSAADALGLGRAWLGPRLARVTEPRAFAALVLAASAGDALDGPLARRAGPTRLGRDLDRLADLCAFGCATGAARRAGWLEPWAARAFVLRYAAGTGYTVARYFVRGAPPPGDARPWSYAATPVFVAGLIAAAAGARRAGSAAVAAASLATLAGQALAARRMASSGR